MADTSFSALTVREKLSKWDAPKQPMAPLSDQQRDAILDLSEFVSARPLPATLVREETSETLLPAPSSPSTSAASFLLDPDLNIDNSQQFYNWFCDVEEQMGNDEEVHYRQYINQLEEYKKQCDEVLEDVNAALGHLDILQTKHNFVSTKTNALHEACEHLLEEQTALMNSAESIQNKLTYFNEIDRIQTKLGAASLTVTSESFIPMLTRLDECIAYISSNPGYKDSAVFLTRFHQSLSKALGLVKSHVVTLLTNVTQQVLPGKGAAPVTDDAFTLFYGKFRTNAPRVKSLMEQIEQRCEKSPYARYEQLLLDCHQCYVTQRAILVEPSVASAVTDLTAKHKQDHCALMRSGCSLMVRVCEDEHQLYNHFFTRPAVLLDDFLERLCTYLYDAFRPLIIHINHMETLSELCSILRVEMLEEHVYNNPQPLGSFERVSLQMLQDVQERLVYRTYIYINTDILNYNPGAGDLAYPDKLEMMQSIAEGMIGKERKVIHSSRSSSTTSLESQEVAHFVGQEHSAVSTSQGSNMPMSPADLHGMWFPTVRKTLVCLSKLVRCIDMNTFQGLSQEALSLCIKSLQSARAKITAKSTPLDGQLFYIKHLLIVREQITPFQAQFSIKETQLGFRHIKDAAMGLIRHGTDIFKFNSNNALLQFLFEGTPQATEYLMDSKQEVDMELKKSCADFIEHVSDLLLKQLEDFLGKVELIQKMNTEVGTQLRSQPFADAENVRDLIAEVYRNLKTKAPQLLKSMSLYLANRDTENILFKPVKTRIQKDVQAVIELVEREYNEEERLIIACPTLEQVMLVIMPKS